MQDDQKFICNFLLNVSKQLGLWMTQQSRAITLFYVYEVKKEKAKFKNKNMPCVRIFGVTFKSPKDTFISGLV